MGKRYFVLSKDGSVVEHVKEDELDIRSRVSIILDDYYRMPQPTMQGNIYG